MQTEQLLQQAIMAHRSGRLAEAERLFRQVHALRPQIAEVHVSLAHILMMQGRTDEALAAAHKAVAALPRNPIAQCRLGDVLALRGDVVEAEQAYRRAIQLKPDFAEACNNLGNILLQQNRLDEAALSYRKAVTARPQFAEAITNLAGIAVRQASLDEALELLETVFALRSNYAPAFGNLGGARMALKDYDQAIVAFQKAVALQPANGEAYNNLGGAFSASGRHIEGLATYQKAAALSPKDSGIVLNIGNALKELGRLPEAEAAYRQAAAMSPQAPLPQQHLAMVVCEQGRLEEGFDLFRKSAALAWMPTDEALDFRRRHDMEQARWTEANGITRGFHIEDTPRLAMPAIHIGDDKRAIEARWKEAKPQIVVIDDFLSMDALTSLRRFCLASSVWQANHQEGYLGAMPETGFAPPLLAQIAEELRAAYPAIFGNHPLLHHWAFKYDSRMHGIKVHADFAAVNVNFWITPDSANLAPQGGGLVVWDIAAPLDWDFQRYNAADDDIRAYLKAHDAKAVVVPYRANRAVIFDSDLFHETDIMHFHDGYENRRINVTLLYGRRAG